MSSAPRVLIVEDDAILIVDLQATLTRMGYQVAGLAATGPAAVAAALAERPDAILMDINLRGDMNGIQAAEQIRQQADIPVIYLTAYTDEGLLQQAKTTDAYAYLAKPVRDRELRASLEMAFYKHAAELRLQQLNQVLRAVRDVNQLITRERDVPRLLDEACQILLHTRGYRHVWIGQLVGARLQARARAGSGAELVEHILASATPEQLARLPGLEAIRTRQAVNCADMRLDARYAPWRAEIETLTLRSALAVPMLSGANLLGVLIVYADQVNRFDAEEEGLLLELAGDISFGLQTIADEAERRQAELALRRSEAKFRAVVENSSDGILFGDAHAVISYRSPSYNRINGYTDAERVGHSGFETAHPDDQAALRQWWAQVVRTPGVALKTEYRIRHKDGNWRHVETTAQNLLDNPDVQEIVVNTQDVTERRQAEAALRASEALFRAVVENSHDGIVMLDRDRRVKYASPSYEQVTGHTPADVAGAVGIGFVHPDDQALTAAAFNEALRTPGASESVEYRLRHKAGHWVWVETTATNLLDDPHVQAVVLHTRDISARREAEQARQESEQRYTSLFHGSQAIMYLIEPATTQIVEANPAACAYYGYTRDEFTALRVSDINTLSPEQLLQEARKVQTGEQRYFLFQHRLRGGAVRHVEVYSSPIQVGGQTLLYSIVHDITERQEAEAALFAQEEQYRSLFENMHSGFILLEVIRDAAGRPVDHRLLQANAAFEAQTGLKREAEIGRTGAELSFQWPAAVAQRYYALGLHGGTLHFERYNESLQRYYDVRAYGAGPGRWAMLFSDITERKRADEQIQQSERKYRELFEVNKDGIAIFMLSPDGTPRPFVELNAAAHQMLGYTRAEMLQLTPGQLEPDTTPEQGRARQAALQARGTVDFETVLAHRDGRRVPAEFTAQLINYEGRPAIMNIVRDLTERKQHEQELRAIAALVSALRAAPVRAAMLPVIVEQLRRLLACDALTIEIIDPATQAAVVEAALGAWLPRLGARQPAGTGLNAVLAETRQPYYCPALADEPRLRALPPASDLRTAAGVPLITQEHLIGFLWLGRRADISAADIQILTAVADIAANAIYRATVHEQALQAAADLVAAYDTTLEGWARALELRDQETEGHAQRVTAMTLRLARLFGLSEAELMHLRRGVLLHDIGKMGVPDSILHKPGPLTDDEWAVMRRHPQLAYDMLAPIAFLRPALDIPYCHHERWNGSGYPRGLRGEQIPLPVRLFSVVDVWDALTSDRPYRPAWLRAAAREYLTREAGRQFDPAVVPVFLELEAQLAGPNAAV